MNATLIYHICTSESWEAQSGNKVYVHDSLTIEGFIHCSESHQIEGVLKRYFQNQQNLIILTIDTSRLSIKLQHDKAPSGEFFPHIYGPITKNAIINIENIR